MLVTLLLWFYMLAISGLYGFFCLYLINKEFEFDQSTSVPFFMISINGLVFITILVSFLSLFIKIGLYANVFLIIGSVVIVVFQWKQLVNILRESLSRIKNSHLLIWLLFLAILLVVLVRSTDKPLNSDTGLYHAQSIRWIEEYKAVPGLGNLLDRLAFNSSWLLASGLFSFSFLGLRSFHALGSFFYLLTTAYFLHKFNHLLRREITFSNVLSAALILLSRRLFIFELSSPGTDMPASLLVWVIFILSLEKIERKETNRFDNQSVSILILSVFVVTIKLSTVPVLLLPLYFLSRELFKRTRQVLVVITLVTVLFIPWLARNVILSGYIIYPFPQIDLFHLDWKIPKKYVVDTANAITSWARIPRVDKQVVLQMAYREWVPIWYHAQSKENRLYLYTIGVGSLSLLVAVILKILRSKEINRLMLNYAILITVGFAGVIFWFVQAPDFRFGYGFLAILAGLLVVPFVVWLLMNLKPVFIPLVYLVLLGLILYQGPSIYRMRYFSQYKERYILPVDYPVVEVTTQTLGGFTASRPVIYDQCWYTPLPCTPINNPEVHMRGKSLGDGFKNKYTH